MIKRALDTVLAACLLVVLSPIIAVCMVLIRAGSSGPAIFRQIRVGWREVPFTCYKLRTMQSSTANLPTHELSSTSVTAIGAFLRRSKLDELPQLVNVLRGEMSFVGPRPCLPQQTELIEQRRVRGVLTVRPGITGLAQIQGIDMSDPARLATIDQLYVSNMSLREDLRIMLATVSGSGSGDRVREAVAKRPDRK